MGAEGGGRGADPIGSGHFTRVGRASALLLFPA